MRDDLRLLKLLTLVMVFILTALVLAGCDDDDDSSGTGEAVCGNGIVEEGEQCDGSNLGNAVECKDLGYTRGTLGCRADCTYDVDGCSSAACGDGVVDSGEECDDGTGNSNEPNASCREDCRLPGCGDGVVDDALGEVCDDGNTQSGDGCSADCHSTEVCGNGIIDVTEECDDGNDVDWDGCNTCTITEFQVNTSTDGDQSVPSVAVSSDGKFVVVWRSESQSGTASSGLYARLYDSDGSSDGSEFQVNTYGASYGWYPVVAMSPDGSFVVIWQNEDQDGSGSGIFGQRYDSDGSPVGSEFPVNSTTQGRQENPSVAMGPNGSFVAVWQNPYQDFSGSDLFGQRYDSDGNPVGGEFRINTYTDGWQHSPRVAVGPDDSFVVVWESDGQDGSGSGIFGQRYDSDGNSVGGEFRINTYTEGHQRSPDIAMDSQGNFVVVWESDGQDGSGSSIFGQHYASDGSPVGGEFQVNAQTHYSQTHPRIAMGFDGRFVVIWSSNDGSYEGVYGRLFDSDGNPQGDEFQVNVYTDDGQVMPDVSMGSDGRFVVVWTSAQQDGSYGGIFAQRYTPDGTPLGLLSMP